MSGLQIGSGSDASDLADAGNAAQQESAPARASRFLRYLHWLAAAVTVGGLSALVIDPGGAALSVAFCAFVVYLVVWGLKLGL